MSDYYTGDEYVISSSPTQKQARLQKRLSICPLFLSSVIIPSSFQTGWDSAHAFRFHTVTFRVSFFSKFSHSEFHQAHSANRSMKLGTEGHSSSLVKSGFFNNKLS